MITWCHVRHAILNSSYDHMEDVRFYSFDSFFFLRIVFDIFNITFHFCFWKSRFWGGFPSKIPFWLSRTSHENGPFAVLDQKYPFWVNLVQKIKIVSFSWNLVLRLIQICRTQWWCSLFPFSTGNSFFGQIWSQNSKLSV